MMETIKKIINGKETHHNYTKEARKVLDEVKNLSKKVKSKTYVHYDRVDPSTEEFLYGIQPVFTNKYLISWLNEHKLQWQGLIKTAVDAENKEAAYLYSVKMSLIDDLFIDLAEFEHQYKEMLNQKEEEREKGRETDGISE